MRMVRTILRNVKADLSLALRGVAALRLRGHLAARKGSGRGKRAEHFGRAAHSTDRPAAILVGPPDGASRRKLSGRSHEGVDAVMAEGARRGCLRCQGTVMEVRTTAAPPFVVGLVGIGDDRVNAVAAGRTGYLQRSSSENASEGLTSATRADRSRDVDLCRLRLGGLYAAVSMLRRRRIAFAVALIRHPALLFFVRSPRPGLAPVA